MEIRASRGNSPTLDKIQEQYGLLPHAHPMYVLPAVGRGGAASGCVKNLWDEGIVKMPEHLLRSSHGVNSYLRPLGCHTGEN
jgi:hypothetical protein